MADDTDVCKSCSLKFDDLKCVIRCSACEHFFHGSCEGITELRGFHRKKTWKCTTCSDGEDVSTISESRSRKRLKSSNGEMVEVDKKILENLVTMVKDLTASVDKMKNQLELIHTENKRLNSLVSSVVTDKHSGVSGFSYAAATKSNLNRAKVTTPAIRTSQSSKTFIFGNNTTPVGMPTDQTVDFGFSANISREMSLEQGNSASGSALDNPSTTPLENDGFKQVQSKRKMQRIMKPILIGSKEGPAAEDSADNKPLFEGSERRKWFYIGRAKAGTQPEMISDYVKKQWNIPEALCFVLKADQRTCSFKLGVAESHASSLMDAAKWPKGVRLREFVHLPRLGNKSNNASTATPSTKPENFHQDPKPASIT